MNENQTNQPRIVRPTKKQKLLLDYIDQFISEHGYSPSYREIMAGLDYSSVATVALHVNNLIKRGMLEKREHSARSLEVVGSNNPIRVTTNAVAPSEGKWLVDKVEHAFKEVEETSINSGETALDDLYILIGALRVLGLDGAAHSFMGRLNSLQQQSKGAKT